MHNLKITNIQYRILLDSVLYYFSTLNDIVNSTKFKNIELEKCEDILYVLKFSFQTTLPIQHIRISDDELLFCTFCLGENYKLETLEQYERFEILKFQSLLQLETSTDNIYINKVLSK